MPTGLDRAVAPLSLLAGKASAEVAAASSEGLAGDLWDGFCCCSSLLFLFLLLAALGIFTISQATLLLSIIMAFISVSLPHCE